VDVASSVAAEEAAAGGEWHGHPLDRRSHADIDRLNGHGPVCERVLAGQQAEVQVGSGCIQRCAYSFA